MANKYIKDLTTTTTPSLTGHTIFDNGISTFKTSLETLKDTIVDGISHTFEGDQTINGDLTISGSIIAHQYILSSSITNMVTETISGSSNFGNSNDDNHSFTGSVKIKGTLSLNNVQLNVSGSGSHLAFFTGPQSVTSSENFHVVANGQTLGLGTDAYNPVQEYRETLVVGAAGSHNIATFQNARDNHYVAVNIINYHSGSDASSDLIIGNDLNEESSSFVNLGVNSSNHTNLDLGYAGDAYLGNWGNDLYVGSMTLSTNPHGHTHLFGGGAWRTPAISVYANSSIGFHTEKIDNQLTTIPSSSYGYRVEFAENVKMDKNLNVGGFTILSYATSSFDNDVDAAAGGVPLNGLYRSGSFVMIRLT